MLPSGICTCCVTRTAQRPSRRRLLSCLVDTTLPAPPRLTLPNAPRSWKCANGFPASLGDCDGRTACAPTHTSPTRSTLSFTDWSFGSTFTIRPCFPSACILSASLVLSMPDLRHACSTADLSGSTWTLIPTCSLPSHSTCWNSLAKTLSRPCPLPPKTCLKMRSASCGERPPPWKPPPPGLPGKPPWNPPASCSRRLSGSERVS
mmetsp:Transcript_39399/g.111468  ORF Transcript_39399/g.111468 Transcript_39399/m.111468 type:complete len:205 (-) Transcript_39399:397-1011(-)